MKAVILAAGMGTRLFNLIPKPLTALIDEKTIMNFQLWRLIDFIGVDNIIIVVGYQYDFIIDRFYKYSYVYNQKYMVPLFNSFLMK